MFDRAGRLAGARRPVPSTTGAHQEPVVAKLRRRGDLGNEAPANAEQAHRRSAVACYTRP